MLAISPTLLLDRRSSIVSSYHLHCRAKTANASVFLRIRQEFPPAFRLFHGLTPTTICCRRIRGSLEPSGWRPGTVFYNILPRQRPGESLEG